MLIIKPCEWKGGIRHAISIDLLSGTQWDQIICEQFKLVHVLLYDIFVCYFGMISR